MSVLVTDLPAIVVEKPVIVIEKIVTYAPVQAAAVDDSGDFRPYDRK
jgi:hypothetical protein